MKMPALLLIPILFLTLISKGYAQVLAQTDTFTNVSIVSSTSIPLTFAAFDSSLGTLNEVDYSLVGSLNINGYITRTAAYNITFNLPYRLEGSGSQLDAQTISSNISGTTTAGAITPDNYNISIQTDNLSTTVTPTSLYFQSGLLKAQTSNSYSISSATVTGTFTLTYDYTPVATPEPSSWALGFIAIGGVLFLRSRVRRS
jgi:hypothetical protein